MMMMRLVSHMHVASRTEYTSRAGRANDSRTSIAIQATDFKSPTKPYEYGMVQAPYLCDGSASQSSIPMDRVQATK